MRKIPAFVGLIFAVGCEFSPRTSKNTCEAMCSWAVSCHAEEREVDASSLREDCLQATYAVDGTCRDADLGALSLAGAEEILPCLSAVDERVRIGECDPFTGTEPAIFAGTPPAQCIGAGRDAGAVFEAARETTIEPSDALCERLTDALCQATAACIVEGFGGTVPPEVVAKTGDPLEVCLGALSAELTVTCQVDDRYASGLPDGEPNPDRDAVRQCLSADEMAATTCPALYAGEWPSACTEALLPAEPAWIAELLGSVAEEYAVSE